MKKPKKARGEQPSRDAAEESVASASEPAAAAAAPVEEPVPVVAPVAAEVAAPAVTKAAPAATADDEDDEDAQPRFDDDGDGPLADDELDERPLPPREPVLTARLSHQLHDKLIRTARDEGVTLESLVQELLAEGVTLRAWEIIERKGAMRGIQPQGSGPQGPRDNNRNFNNNQHGNRHQGGHQGHRGPGGNNGRMSNNRAPGRGNNAWMEDKAAFLEYVRNQEKRRR